MTCNSFKFKLVLAMVWLCAVAHRTICRCAHSSSSSFVAVAVLVRAGERLLGELNAPLERLLVDDSRCAALLRQRR